MFGRFGLMYEWADLFFPIWKGVNIKYQICNPLVLKGKTEPIFNRNFSITRWRKYWRRGSFFQWELTMLISLPTFSSLSLFLSLSLSLFFLVFFLYPLSLSLSFSLSHTRFCVCGGWFPMSNYTFFCKKWQHLLTKINANICCRCLTYGSRKNVVICGKINRFFVWIKLWLK